jgi:hypothetical protein
VAQSGTAQEPVSPLMELMLLQQMVVQANLTLLLPLP